MKRKAKNAKLIIENNEETEFPIASFSMEMELEPLAKAARVAATSLSEIAARMAELEDAITQHWLSPFEEDRELQASFTNWKDFLDMQPERLPHLSYQTHESLFSPSGLETIELVPPAKSTYALTHQPGAIFQAAPNEWYCQSGTNSDVQGSGYMVTRRYIEHKKEFRWFCTCVQGKKNMYTESPYCKHMYAVAEYNKKLGGLHRWTEFPYLIDVLAWWKYCDDLGFFINELYSLEEYRTVIDNTKI